MIKDVRCNDIVRHTMRDVLLIWGGFFVVVVDCVCVCVCVRACVHACVCTLTSDFACVG